MLRVLNKRAIEKMSLNSTDYNLCSIKIPRRLSLKQYPKTYPLNDTPIKKKRKYASWHYFLN